MSTLYWSKTDASPEGITNAASSSSTGTEPGDLVLDRKSAWKVYNVSFPCLFHVCKTHDQRNLGTEQVVRGAAVAEEVRVPGAFSFAIFSFCLYARNTLHIQWLVRRWV